MSEVYANRRSRLRDHFNAVSTAAALVTRPANVRYLAAAAPHGAVLPGGSEDLLVCAVPPDDRPSRAARTRPCGYRSCPRGAATPP